MKDANGREYAKLSQLAAGHLVVLDDGFDCSIDNVVDIEDDAGRLYFDCIDGKHYLEGQLADDSDSLIGVYLLPKDTNNEA